jgi:3-oxoacyl-[acyl-carrier protein] reductase
LGRIVWITGASTGIGRALAEVFVEKGDVVVLSARRGALLSSLAHAIREAGGECAAVPCDVRHENSVRKASREIRRIFGRVDVLVNNAGITSFQAFEKLSTGEFDDILSTNLRGAFLATQSVLPDMLRRKAGMIINVISYAAKTTYTGSSVYSASKSGLQAMMNGLRAETRHRGIKVVNVYPGAIVTPMWKATHQRKYAKLMMVPREVANLIYEASAQPHSGMVEEIVIRPQVGDLRV